MKISDIRKLTTDELKKKELDLRDEISKLSFQHRIRPLENTSKMSELRKDIARILTLRNQMSVN